MGEDNDAPFSLLNKDEESNREFKVRIVERLTFLESKLHNNTGQE